MEKGGEYTMLVARLRHLFGGLSQLFLPLLAGKVRGSSDSGASYKFPSVSRT